MAKKEFSLDLIFPSTAKAKRRDNRISSCTRTEKRDNKVCFSCKPECMEDERRQSNQEDQKLNALHSREQDFFTKQVPK